MSHNGIECESGIRVIELSSGKPFARESGTDYRGVSFSESLSKGRGKGRMIPGRASSHQECVSISLGSGREGLLFSFQIPKGNRQQKGFP